MCDVFSMANEEGNQEGRPDAVVSPARTGSAQESHIRSEIVAKGITLRNETKKFVDMAAKGADAIQLSNQWQLIQDLAASVDGEIFELKENRFAAFIEHSRRGVRPAVAAQEGAGAAEQGVPVSSATLHGSRANSRVFGVFGRLRWCSFR